MKITPHASHTLAEIQLSKGLKWSFIIHLGLIFVVGIKTTFFPETAIKHIPSLRVDVVALPDLLKKDLKKIGGAPKKTVEKKKTKPKKKTKEKTAVLPEKRKKARKKKMQNALARIRALEKLQSDEPGTIAAPEKIKGNKISKGSALTGNARENATNLYYDQIHARLKQNWTLPVWLSRQDLSAQALIFLDKSGKVTTFLLKKSSGNPQFDDQVRNCIDKSQPFPVPPKELRRSVTVNGILLGFPL